MSKFELLKTNVIEEVLRERANYYFSKNRANDFWIIEYPKFTSEKNFVNELNKTKFYKKNKNEEYFAIVSSDKTFINWLALRIGYFESLDQIKKELTKEYVVNGITGSTKYLPINPLLSIE
jgi:hypothetical protein